MKTIEKMAEEQIAQLREALGQTGVMQVDLYSIVRKTYMAGWRACREALAKRHWTERVDTYDLANFGEEESE